MNSLGNQIDLDLGEGQIKSGILIDDIRSCCSQLTMSFLSPRLLNFNGTSQCYFTYRNVCWVPASVKQCKVKDNFLVQVEAYPKPYFDFVEAPTRDTRSLAKSLDLELVSDGQSLPIFCPILGLTGSNVVNEYRKQSYQEAFRKNNMGESYFIYFDSKNLLSVTFSKLMNQKSLSLEVPEYLQNSTITNYCDDRIFTRLSCYKSAGHWNQNDYIYRLMGRKFEIKSTVPSAFARTYTIRFEDSSEFDIDSKFLCVRCEQDIMEANGFNITLSEINYVR